jgi:hypothetical protein
MFEQQASRSGNQPFGIWFQKAKMSNCSEDDDDYEDEEEDSDNSSEVAEEQGTEAL